MFEHPMYGRRLSPSIPEIERDHEDILMIQYPNNAHNQANSNNNAEAANRTVRDRDSQAGGGNMSISVANNGTAGNASNEQPQNFLFNANFPIFDNENSEQGGNENSNSAQGAQSNSSNEPVAQPINSNAPPPNNHPLLSGRPDGNSDRAEDRLHDGTSGLQTARRTGRARRYQFINLNSRNPPVILQRMLELRQNRAGHQNAGNAGGGNGSDPVLFRDGTRVVVMDNGISIFSNDDLDFEMLDQSGYWFGRTLANHLNNHPSALGWWQEENKISGPESNSDLCMIVCDEMIPELDALRASELSKIRCNKRKKKSTDEDEIKQKNQEKKTNEEEPLVVQPELALSSALANVPVPVEPIRVTDPSEESNQLNEDRSVETMQVLEIAESVVATATETSSNNLDEASRQQQQQSGSQPITISTQVVEQPQQITTDNQLNIMDFDFEMASDNDESSASANNSRSFSPNFSPMSSNRVEASGMNMLNRETSSQSAEQQQQVNNLNIQDQNAERRVVEHDYPMGNESDNNSDEEFIQNNEQAENQALELGIHTPTDSDSDPELSNEDTDDEEEGAVGGVTNEVENPTSDTNPPTQSDEAANTENENAENQEVAAGGIATVQDMDPSVRAILGDLQVPEGVDPSFLAALPQEMRDEVIQEHLR